MISMFCVLLSSCGIPDIRVYGDNFKLYNSSKSDFNLFVYDYNSVSSDFATSSPGILLLYSISSTNNYLPMTEFNKEYTQQTHGVPVSFTSSPMVGVTSMGSGDDKYETGLYPLVPEGLSYSDISAPGYTISLTELLTQSSGQQIVNFVFSLENNESNKENILKLNIGDSTEPIILNRYNGGSFYHLDDIDTFDSNAKRNDYLMASRQDNPTSTTYIDIYAAVNCVGGFSNIYWTSLYRVARVDIQN